MAAGVTGQPEPISRAAVEYLVRQLGLRGGLHPDDVFGYVHATRASYDRSAALNRGTHGNRIHGPVRIGDLFVQLVDVTPRLVATGARPTDPQLPDRVTEPCCDLHGRNCEPPSELCCAHCTEFDHPRHILLGPCSAPDLSGSSVTGGPATLTGPARHHRLRDGSTVEDPD